MLQKLIDNNIVKFYRLINGENPFNIYKFVDSDVLIIHGQVWLSKRENYYFKTNFELISE